MYQPSANQIANLYQGNPTALAQKIATEPKGPTGLPRDLSKLMALNIDLTETDAAKRQAALQGLQQMQQGQPEPPTVAQSIQQQAMEKAKALLVQQQRQQQGLQALAQQQGLFGAVPERTPQPERQPSGLDELQSNMGENYAGGGIVAFSGEDGSEVKDEEPKKLRQYTLAEQGADWEARLQAARDAEEARGATSPAGDVARGLASLVKRGATAVGNAFDNLSERQKVRQAMEQNRPGLFEALTDAERADRKEKSKQLLGQLNQLVESKPATAAAPVEATPLADIRGQLNAAEGRASGLPAAVASAATPAAPRANPNVVPSMAQGAGAQRVSSNVATPAAPAEKSLYDKWMEQALSQTPEARRDAAIKRYQESIGAPDTSAQEKYIQQLEARRAEFAEPTDPYERFRRYARTAANAGGRTSLQTGAATSQALEQQRLANAQKDMEVLKELMGESSKLADVKRGIKKEAFTFGEKEYDDAYKYGFDAAKELGLQGRQRELFAHQSAESALDRANRIAVAGMPSGEQKEFNMYAKDWMAKPENAGKTLSDAYGAYKLAGQGFRPEQARVGMIEKYAKDWSTMDMVDKMKYNKEGINNAEDYVKYMMRITEQNKPGAAPSAGAPITKAQYDALPKGASYTAPDGSQRIKG